MGVEAIPKQLSGGLGTIHIDAWSVGPERSVLSSSALMLFVVSSGTATRDAQAGVKTSRVLTNGADIPSSAVHYTWWPSEN